MRGTNITHLHESLIMKILSYVPPKFIIRCRCVCKDWDSLITLRDFSKFYSCGNVPTLFLVQDNIKSLLLADIDEVSCIKSNNRVSLLLPDYILTFGIICSCKLSGCVLASGHYVKESAYHYQVFRTLHKYYCIFNPMNGQHIVIQPENANDTLLSQHCSLVYALKANQVKLLKFRNISRESVIFIQTIGTNVWRKIRIKTSIPRTAGKNSVLVNGLYHWIVFTNETVIYSFDAEGESLVEIPVPRCLMLHFHRNIGLGLLEDCLCVLTKLENNLEWWVMNEYGNPKSWNRKFVITDFGWRSIGGLETLGYLKNGEVLLISYPHGVIIYNPNTGNYRFIDFGFGNFSWYDIVPFAPNFGTLLPAPENV